MDIIEDQTPQPERTPELLKFEFNTIKDKLREQRNKLLVETDKYLIPDYPVLPEKLELIKAYRQSLRDYMNMVDDLDYTQQIPPMPQCPFLNI